MDGSKPVIDVKKQKLFMKLHEKVHNKYNQMRFKLEKSKSTSELTSLSDIYDFKQTNFSSHMAEAPPYDSYEEDVKHEVEEIDESLFQELSSISTTNGLKLRKPPLNSEDLFESDIDDIPELKEEIYYPSTSKTRRLSIRDKINNKLSAAKEKRRKEEQAVFEKKRLSREKIEKYLYNNCTTPTQKLHKKKQKLATLSVAVLEAKIPKQLVHEDKSRTFYCRLRLGIEKRKTKTLRTCSALMVNWQELFNLCLYDETELEISVCDKENILIGRCNIDISELEKEKTHKVHLTTTEGEASVELFVLLTVTGIATSDEYVEPEDVDIMNNELLHMGDDYKWYKVRKFKDVGRLCVMVYSARGLSEKDCFCVVELDNERLQTTTIYKTNNPCWMKFFKFDVTDITKDIEITIVDEKKYEEIGKVVIPLLSVTNREKRWYTLKDTTLREKAKGNNPRIFLEIWVVWNVVKASFRVIHPKEARYLKTVPKLDRQTFGRNWARLKVILNWLGDAKATITTCFEWESKRWNVMGLAVWLFLCSYVRLWMIPLFLLIPFAYYGREKNFLLQWEKYIVRRIYDLKDTEEKIEKSQTLKQKINNIHDIVQTAQNTIGSFASLGEQVKNLFNFTVPYLSYLSIFFILLITLVLRLVPVHIILMVWGVHKFTRKIIKPNRIPNNEVLDLLSRVPDDEKLLDYSEVPLHPLSEDIDMLDIEDI